MTRRRIIVAAAVAVFIGMELLLLWQQDLIQWQERDQTRLVQAQRDERVARTALVRKLQAIKQEAQMYREQASEVHGLRNSVAQLSRGKIELEEQLQMLGRGVQISKASRFVGPGNLVKTDKVLDLAIEGDGFFEVLLGDGTQAYTRDGAFQVTPNGAVLSSHGLAVSGFPPVLHGWNRIDVNEDGEVTIRTSDNSESFRLQLTRFVNPEGLASVGSNLFKETSESGPPEVGNPRENDFGAIAQGYLEIPQ